ncbi:MAG TPA: heme-binding protein, partial [Candidatus Sumerlaeota bacterium]|nr:heme-binding protein [Candidatus Sumerlaeota bacterium]
MILQDDRRPTMSPLGADITAEQAQAVLEAARKKAEQLKLAMNIAVVDAGANLKAFLRMDG